VLEQRVVLAHHRQSAQHVAVTAEILGATVDDEVDTEVAGPLADGCSQGVVADRQRSCPMGDGSDRLEIRDVEQRVGRRFDPDHVCPPADGIPHRCEVGEIGKLHSNAATRAVFGELLDRAIVSIERRYQAIARV